MPASALPSSRVPIWEWVLAALVAVNLAWTTLCLGGAHPETMVVTCALNALMLALHGAWRAMAATPRPPLHPAGWLLLPFLAYALINVLWITPVRWLGWHDWLVWAQMIAVFWVVVNDVRAWATRKFVFGAMVAIATVAVALACYQRFARPDWLMLGRTQAPQFFGRSSGPFPVPNSFAAMLVLLLPATVLPLWARGVGAVARVGLGYLAALFALGLGLTVSRGAWLGGALAVAAWPFFSAGLGWRKRLGIFASIVGVMGGVVAVVYTSMPLARERLGYLTRDAGEKSRPILWRAAWQIAQEHPVVGGGAGSYAVRFEQYRPESEQKNPQWTHNDYLNTLSDYGIAGFGLFFGACGVIAWQCARRPARKQERSDWFESRAFTTALAVGLLAFSLHLFVDFHLKVPALAMLAATVAGLMVPRAWPVDAAGLKTSDAALSARRWIAGGAVAAGAMIFAAGWGVPHYRAEAEREDARQALDDLARAPSSAAERRVITDHSRERFTRAVAIDPANAQAWADRAYTAAILGHDDPVRESELGRSAEADARRALAYSIAVPEFWLRLGVALDMQGKTKEAGEAFAEAMRLAPVNALTWFYYAYHLSLDRSTWLLAESAVAISLRLDPYRPEADALRKHLTERRRR